MKFNRELQVMIERIGLRLHLCADTGAAMGAFFQDLASQFKPLEAEKPPKVRTRPSMVGEHTLSKSALASTFSFALLSVEIEVL